MPYKFKVGDRVKVATLRGPDVGSMEAFVGRTGKVTIHDAECTWPYEVTGSKWMGVFSASELEAAPAKTRKKRGK